MKNPHFCTPRINAKIFNIEIPDLNNVSIVIIHYSEYSTKRMRFYANYRRTKFNRKYINLNQKVFSRRNY